VVLDRWLSVVRLQRHGHVVPAWIVVIAHWTTVSLSTASRLSQHLCLLYCPGVVPACFRQGLHGLVPESFLLSYFVFVFSFPYFFISVLFARLTCSWVHINISYRISGGLNRTREGCVRAARWRGRHFEGQGSYRSWKVLEFYCSEFQDLESPGKGIGLESPGIVNQQFWNCSFWFE